LLVLVSGALTVSYQPDRGPSVHVDDVSPGEVLGELSCCDPAPLAASVHATEPSVVYVLDRTMLTALKKNAPQLASGLYNGIILCVSERSRKLEARILASAGPLRRLGARVSAHDSAANVPQHLNHTSMDGVHPTDIEMLATIGTQRKLMAGEALFHEGQPGASCFVITHGQLDVLRGPTRQLRRLCTLGPGALFGQMALINKTQRSATTRALSPVSAIEITVDMFERLLCSEQDFALRFQEKIAVSAIRQHRRILKRLDGVLKLSNRDSAQSDRIEDEIETVLSDHVAGLRDLSISPDELSSISVVVPEGQMSAAEIKARLGR